MAPGLSLKGKFSRAGNVQSKAPMPRYDMGPLAFVIFSFFFFVKASIDIVARIGNKD